MPFEGFSRKTLDFLVENRIQNRKAWFEEHRGDYNRHVLTPLRELVTALTPAMLKIDPLFTVEPSVNKTIARIYRDVRVCQIYEGTSDVQKIIIQRAL